MDEELREMIMMLPRFGGYQKLAMEYCELFGVTPMRINTKKMARLLGQVATFLEKEAFEWERKTYRISKRGVAEALNLTCNKRFDAPLRNHNYLKTVMKAISEREERERSVEGEKELRKKEERIRGGVREEAPGVSLKEFKKRQGINSLVDEIGKAF